MPQSFDNFSEYFFGLSLIWKMGAGCVIYFAISAFLMVILSLTNYINENRALRWGISIHDGSDKNLRAMIVFLFWLWPIWVVCQLVYWSISSWFGFISTVIFLPVRFFERITEWKTSLLNYQKKIAEASAKKTELSSPKCVFCKGSDGTLKMLTGTGLKVEKYYHEACLENIEEM